ncbi:MAG TPA: hypothetical protein VK705_08385, partial [Ferruginibacter sp.]|nr:hypothetical protein [Ferruginibacter sp.]
MLSNLTYKQKLKLFGVASFLLVILCYQFSIKRTIQEYLKYDQFEDLNNYHGESNIDIRDIQSKSTKVNTLYKQFLLDTLQADKNLLSVASNYCKENNIQLKQYKPIYALGNDSIKVLTMEVTVEGSYIKCLNLLYELETKKKLG